MIRPARPSDVPTILRLIHELAEFERAADEVHATEELLHDALFGPEPHVRVHIAEHTDGTVAGFALWFVNFSTWLGRHGVYLEDLYVRPELRGHGYGRALLSELARICLDRDYGRLEWWVLHWNPAREFYHSIGAVAMDEWVPYRIDGAALRALAGNEVPTDHSNLPGIGND
ncbi:MAG: GNAT family N-acetyltransferase [Sporichthyaceae bacterium]|nr:GNAT family N-acetyltransferase [Sporichthyaceae bacterium]